MEHLQFIITHIRRETATAKTYFIREINGRVVSYKAGQFLTLIINAGKEIRRSYSLSSTPGIDDEMFFTIKSIENGEVSRYLFDKLKQGDVIE